MSDRPQAPARIVQQQLRNYSFTIRRAEKRTAFLRNDAFMTCTQSPGNAVVRHPDA